ncbi:MAG: bis(5'-nucleosyl)-tetraphosphatase (symmetrical) YqeK [Clostridia bacterium]|nr:bis(5'-nucleosyl)-tetraphosphatase (symmetrical) YqeK [Clostridia bacterium]
MADISSLRSSGSRTDGTHAFPEAGSAELSELLAKVRLDLPRRLSPKRLIHVLAVEDMAVRLCRIYLPRDEGRLRAAALLHDITKEYTVERHLGVCRKYGIKPTAIETAAPKTLHAITAAALIPDEYPALADPGVIRAVRWHTTGRRGMTMLEKLIYLADYIDESRTFPECVRLRGMFWDADPASMDAEERKEHLTRVLIESFDITVRGLLDDGLPIHPSTSEARNSLILLLKKDENRQSVPKEKKG